MLLLVVLEINKYFSTVVGTYRPRPSTRIVLGTSVPSVFKCIILPLVATTRAHHDAVACSTMRLLTFGDN